MLAVVVVAPDVAVVVGADVVEGRTVDVGLTDVTVVVVANVVDELVDEESVLPVMVEVVAAASASASDRLA